MDNYELERYVKNFVDKKFQTRKTEAEKIRSNWIRDFREVYPLIEAKYAKLVKEAEAELTKYCKSLNVQVIGNCFHDVPAQGIYSYVPIKKAKEVNEAYEFLKNYSNNTDLAISRATAALELNGAITIDELDKIVDDVKF